jgi:putative toxin-antitoxin system antitoxin component (TIGR02293 family)
MADAMVPKRQRRTPAAKSQASTPVTASFRVQLTGSTNALAVRLKVTRAGVTGGKLRDMRERLGLTIADVSRVLGAGERTVIRKEQSRASLSTTEADRAYRLARVADLAIELIGDEARAKAWLRVPNTYLGGETPVGMLDTEVGTDLVVESLYAIAYGGVA